MTVHDNMTANMTEAVEKHQQILYQKMKPWIIRGFILLYVVILTKIKHIIPYLSVFVSLHAFISLIDVQNNARIFPL